MVQSPHERSSSFAAASPSFVGGGADPRSAPRRCTRPTPAASRSVDRPRRIDPHRCAGASSLVSFPPSLPLRPALLVLRPRLRLLSAVVRRNCRPEPLMALEHDVRLLVVRAIGRLPCLALVNPHVGAGQLGIRACQCPPCVFERRHARRDPRRSRCPNPDATGRNVRACCRHQAEGRQRDERFAHAKRTTARAGSTAVLHRAGSDGLLPRITPRA